MIRNYITIALRSLSGSKLYSLLTIGGLALGMAASILIALFVVHELNFDKFHINSDRIYRVGVQIKFGEQTINTMAVSSAFAAAIKNSSADVISAVRFAERSHVLLGNGSNQFFEDKFAFADDLIFSVFSFDLAYGDPKTVLSKPNTIVISQSAAKKYFGEENPIGKTITFFQNATSANQSPDQTRTHLFTVTGVLQDMPSYSSLNFDFVASFMSLATIDNEREQYASEKVGLGNCITYFLLSSPDVAFKVEESIGRIVPKSEGMELAFYLEPITSLHLQSRMSSGNLRYVKIFSAISFIILVLALTNYISLTTARATIRAKEIGVRKVNGATRPQLVWQFMSESLLTSVLSLVLALLIAFVTLPLVLELLQLNINNSFLTQPQFITMVLVILLVSSAIAGFYPALLLSRFAPIEVIKGKYSSGNGGVKIRKFFIVLQFVASISLIICCVVIRNQLLFMSSTPIGFNKDQLLVIPLEPSIGLQYKTLKDEMSKHPEVLSVSVSTSVPFTAAGTNMRFTKTSDNRDIGLFYSIVDRDFIKTFAIDWYSKAPNAEFFSDNPSNALLNETAVERLKLEKPLGTHIPFGESPVEVVGVVKDFVFQSIHTQVNPIVLIPMTDTENAMQQGGYITTRLAPTANVSLFLKKAEATYKNHQPDKPFTYFFLEEAFDKLFKSEERLAKILTVFTFLAIAIACFGLFGLATFLSERKSKEISIRKVMGASISSIILLLSRDFIGLILIANVIAWPITWWIMHNWLEDFAIRTNIGWWIFALAGGIVILIAFLTICFQVTKAALTNPVKRLRIE